MPRVLVTSLVPAAVVCVSWLRIEEPPRSREIFVVAGLALAAALLPRWRLRVPALVAAALVTFWIAFAAEPWELLPGRDERVLDPVLESVYFGVGDFYGVLLPFDPSRHPEMHSLVLVAAFGFVAALALLLGAGRPFAAAAVATAGVCWPATLLDAGAATIGVVALAGVLWIFLTRRVRSFGTLAVGAAVSCAVIAGAVWVSTATSFARDAALEWQSWDFRGVPARALGVRFVWNASYDGISFPPTKTIVLEIRAADRPEYWRASTLDLFTADRWIEDLSPVLIGDTVGELPRDRLSPPRSADRDSWVEQTVIVKALVDDRLVAAGQPTAFDAPGTILFLDGGVARARHELDPGTRYRVWSYIPDPTPAALAAAPARYPNETRRFLSVWGRALPPFGVPGRDAEVGRLLADTAYPGFHAYRPLYEQARRRARGAESPYEAVLAIESWLRRTGGFRYEEQPVHARDLPPLVEFVTVTKAGYCQHFAGAMAVMLRLLGIPSRVAVGFTSGTYDDGKWKVTDHDAHAWVEVWFPGYGWVPFDPTPGRGTFAGTYSYASENAQAVAALGRGEITGDSTGLGGGRRGGSSAPGVRGGERNAAPSIAGLALLLGALWVLAVAAIKAVRRRVGRLARDPRRAGTATRRELEAFLRDQRVEIPASATLAWLQRAARDELGLDADAFATAAARARFGPPREAAAAAHAARGELHALIRKARRQLSPWARARGLVSLRSLRGGGAA